MGELILCRAPLTASPYYIEEKSLNIYSLEELSYYLAHNIYLLRPDFMNPDLIRWIGEDLGEKKLAEALKGLMDRKAPLHIFISRILEETGYLTPPEIQRTVREIETFESKGEVESRKIRADHLLQEGHVMDAVREYEGILKDSERLKPSAELQGDLWHNLGVGQVRLLSFPEAEDSFRRAYEKNHRTISLCSLLEACLIEGNEEAYKENLHRYLVPPDLEKEVEDAVRIEAEAEPLVKFGEDVDSAFSQVVTSEGRTVSKDIRDTIEQWKQDYLLQC
ncbi:MAG: hypothetical protein PUG16_04630 [Lachnospiraceae bacterium]|jgi:hypothetical protein|nr:hypothetical protein [Lachnospiraceae bacterium]